jgi:regulator of sirC expression with transglutaminase-like and TPR domain
MTLAGTRMYLFDMVERLFANRQQSVAEQLRQALREARDVQALRSVCDALLNAVAQHAGAQRAMQLSQQLVHLVPDWSLESHDHAP